MSLVRVLPGYCGRSPGNGAGCREQVRQGAIAGRDSAMEGLTPASADDLAPLGGLLVDDPFWRYPAWGLAREGIGHLRVWATATASPGYLAVVSETGGIISVTESAGRIWAGLARRYGPSLVLLEHHPAPGFGREWRPWTWSASALTGARTGPACGRPRRTIPVMPGRSCGWPLTGTRSLTGPRARSTGARAADRRTVAPRNLTLPYVASIRDAIARL